MATEHIRSGKTFHTPPSGNRDRHGSKSGTGFFSGMFGSGKPSGGAGAAASSVHQPSTSHAGGNRMKSAKGGGDKGKGLPTTSTEEAPPTKRTRTLHRSQSAHPSTARSAVRSPPSAHHEGAGSSKRNFPCEQCSSSFTQRGQLLRHVRRVHEHLRPYACQLCGSKFGARSDRNRHIQVRPRDLLF